MINLKNPLTMFLLIILSVSCTKDDEGNNEIVEIPRANLVSYYPFNGNVNDESDNKNNGTNFGASLTTDRFGNENAAFQFDGIDDYIEIMPVSDVSAIGDFTFSVWVYLEEWENQVGFNELDFQYVFNGHANSSMANSDFFKPGFNVVYRLSNSEEELLQNYILYATDDISNNYLLTNKSLSVLGQWRHIVWGRKGSQDFTYINGQYFEQSYLNQINKSTPINMQHNWYIGTFSGNNPNYVDFNYNFHGKIDDIRFYDTALEEKYIKAIFQE